MFRAEGLDESGCFRLAHRFLGWTLYQRFGGPGVGPSCRDCAYGGGQESIYVVRRMLMKLMT